MKKAVPMQGGKKPRKKKKLNPKVKKTGGHLAARQKRLVKKKERN